MNKPLLAIAMAAAALCNASVAAALDLPSFFSDNMMLQQQSDARIWGTAPAGSTIAVTPSWSGRTVKTRTGADGRWQLTVPTPAASFENHTIKISDGKESRTISNVLVGEVWLASGQSNMEMPLRGYWTQPIEGAAHTIAYSGKYPGIRFITVPKRGSYEPQSDIDARWKTSCPANAADFSAQAYHFAQTLTDLLDVPVGIISCAYGGSKVEGWIPKDILDGYEGWSVEAERDSASLQEYERINVMYNAMLHPLVGYNVRGFIWNQGESNVGREYEYPQHQADMVERWRQEWNLGELPFYFVELPGWDYGNPEGTNAAEFRECQHKAAELIPNSGIVCTSDLVNPDELHDIHASRKREIGERMGWMAAHRTYGIQGLPDSYPRYSHMELAGRKAILHFTDADAGFTPNDELPGFEVAGPDGKFYPARATEDWNARTIIVEAPDSVAVIDEVRYCFKNFAIGKVKDLMGMPLIPFRAKAPKYVSVADGEFSIGGKPYRYVGANFWYGAILASEGIGGNRQRLSAELDNMQALGIDNLRILVGGQGNKSIMSHIEPTLELEPGVYNEDILKGLDYLLVELERRGMKAVLYLNNAWEWSGGYGCYLEWAGKGECPVPALTSYPEYMDYVAAFVHDDKAKQLSMNHLRNIVGRTNSITGKPYSQSTAIMSWQIANEPRAFSDSGKQPFAEWLKAAAAEIKRIDPNHLVSTGSEGLWGCENDLDLWADIHSDRNIDYGTIHIWPYNWGWVRRESLAEDLPQAFANTRDYIEQHHARTSVMGKPLVLEEFGFPRDGMAITPGSPVNSRDSYYEYVFSIIRDSGMINGANFWGWGGDARPLHRSWQPGDDYSGDPAQEDQGLNSVFSADRSTTDMIRRLNSEISRR